jgi:DNA mismatch endonuclease (patch repair protein)
MQLQRRVGTAPELALRSELWRRGRRFRVDFAVVGRRRRVDIAFTRLKVAVFVDGCFWHSCPEHGSLPKNNRDWWRVKLEANTRRDRLTDAVLAEAGWRVVRVWEHEPVTLAADRVESELGAVGSLGHAPSA